jgi:RNA polymerase sigma factor (sigma-70 family)
MWAQLFGNRLWQSIVVFSNIDEATPRGPRSSDLAAREEIHVSDDGSISQWLEGMKAGEAADIEKLWERYFHRLVGLAGARLRGHALRDYDEEDVALSAFHSFCDRVGRGQFAQVDDRNDLWRLLATITARKAIKMIRYQNRLKRGGGQVLGESAIMGPHDSDDGVAQFLSREPAPEAAAQFAEDFDRLIANLENPGLRTIALRKLEGYTTEEIATELDISPRSVDRKLQVIREMWREVPD